MDWNLFWQIIWRTSLKFGTVYLTTRSQGASNSASLMTAGMAVAVGESKGIKETFKSK